MQNWNHSTANYVDETNDRKKKHPAETEQEEHTDPRKNPPTVVRRQDAILYRTPPLRILRTPN
jgi:hypothetical protein